MSTDNVKILKSDYLPFLEEIKGKIKSARIQAYRRINKEIILLYWDIGKKIVQRQDQFGWGKRVVEKLSADLKKEFPGLSGYSARNLWDMRRFYLEYKNNEKLRRLVAEIPWGQNLVIMYRVKDYREREFYIRKTFEYGWTRDVLGILAWHQNSPKFDEEEAEKGIISTRGNEGVCPLAYSRTGSRRRITAKDFMPASSISNSMCPWVLSGMQ